MTNFVFDVDGTLTPSRGKMEEGFKRFFLKFIKEHSVYIVTGSDYYKTVEQVGVEVCESVQRVFNCSGNSIWKNGENIFNTDWTMPKEAKGWCNTKLSESADEKVKEKKEVKSEAKKEKKTAKPTKAPKKVAKKTKSTKKVSKK